MLSFSFAAQRWCVTQTVQRASLLACSFATRSWWRKVKANGFDFAQNETFGRRPDTNVEWIANGFHKKKNSISQANTNKHHDNFLTPGWSNSLAKHWREQKLLQLHSARPRERKTNKKGKVDSQQKHDFHMGGIRSSTQTPPSPHTPHCYYYYTQLLLQHYRVIQCPCPFACPSISMSISMPIVYVHVHVHCHCHCHCRHCHCHELTPQSQVPIQIFSVPNIRFIKKKVLKN